MTHAPRWHRNSVFGAGPRRPLDREQRARFRFLLNAHRRARRLTPLTELVGSALIRRLGTDGQLDPSHDTLAADVGCSARTVRRALATLRQLGLLSWQRRLVRTGWRVLQTSSAYALSIDGTQPHTGGQCGRETRKLSIKPIMNPLGLALQGTPAKRKADALERALAGLAGAAGLALG